MNKETKYAFNEMYKNRTPEKQTQLVDILISALKGADDVISKKDDDGVRGVFSEPFDIKVLPKAHEITVINKYLKRLNIQRGVLDDSLLRFNSLTTITREICEKLIEFDNKYKKLKSKVDSDDIKFSEIRELDSALIPIFNSVLEGKSSCNVITESKFKNKKFLYQGYGYSIKYSVKNIQDDFSRIKNTALDISWALNSFIEQLKDEENADATDEEKVECFKSCLDFVENLLYDIKATVLLIYELGG